MPHTATPAPENRAEGRSNVFLTATLAANGGTARVRIRNISGRGALVDGPALPAVGTKVRLVRGRLSAAGQLAWAGSGQAGVNFEREIDVASWVQRTGDAGQQRVDYVIDALRRSAPVPSELQEQAATSSLESISSELDRICDRLAQTERMSTEFGEELVKLDSLAQALRGLASRSERQL